jgi:hypothetical protein
MVDAAQQWEQAKASAAAGHEDTDIARIAAAFADLRGQGIIAEGALGETSSAGWDDVATMADDDDEEPDAVFWNMQSHDAFDASGRLVGDLALQWSGDSHAIVSAIEAKGFEVVAPTSERDVIVVRPAGADHDAGDAGGADIDTFHAVLGDAGWAGRWAGTMVQYVRPDPGGLQVRVDFDKAVLLVDVTEGDEVVATREIPYGSHFREVLAALTGVQGDVTVANADEALAPVVAVGG